jgi:hypothetical protein
MKKKFRFLLVPWLLLQSLAAASLAALLAALGLSGCQTIDRTLDRMKPRDPRTVSSDVLEFQAPAGQPFGGFSGLWFEGRDEKTGDWKFTTTTDRGPNLEAKTNEKGETLRPFVDPKFRLQWIRFTYHPDDKKLQLKERVELSLPDGRAIMGLPNLPPGEGDEIAVDLKDQLLAPDPMGLDLESLARDTDGTYWMGEEYRPSLLHFSATGRLLTRWVPEGTNEKFGIPVLAPHLLQRRLNRGFEAIALDGDSVYGFLQSGLKGEPDVTRIEQVDKRTGKPVATFIYPFETTPAGWPKVDKIGDAVSNGRGEFYVIEQNGATKEDAFRRIYKIDLRGGTNLLRTPNKLVTLQDLCERERTAEGSESCLLPVRKTFVADLADHGLRDSDKAEGLAFIDDDTLAVVNDNDFSTRPTRLVILHLPREKQSGK